MYACAKMLGEHKRRCVSETSQQEADTVLLEEKDHLRLGVKRCSHTDFDENGPDLELVVDSLVMKLVINLAYTEPKKEPCHC